MPLSQGGAFVNKSGPHLSTHLWIVLSDPNLDRNRVVIVNITSWRNDATPMNDSSCILEANEHPFIKHKSYVYYHYAIITTVNNIENGFTGGVLEPQDDCSSELLDKILLGASQSQHIPIKIIGVLQEQGLID